MNKIILKSLLTFFSFSNLFANEEIENLTNDNAFPMENYQTSLTKMFFMVLILIAFLILTLWLLKKFLNSRMQAASVGKAIQILEQRTISPKSILYLIEVNGEKFLIAESQVNVQRIENLKVPLKNTD